MNISHILRKERSPYRGIHAFFWLITWVFAIWMFVYCNGWSINLSVVKFLPQNWISSWSISNTNSPKGPEFLERFWFALIDTQSDNITISLDGNERTKKIVQEKVSYGIHHINIEWPGSDSINFDFDINNDHQFIRRNFSILSKPRTYKIDKNSWEKKGESLCLGIWHAYTEEKRNCKGIQQYKYGVSTASGYIRMTNTNTLISPILANEVGFVLSWTITIPREYFGSDVFVVPNTESWSIRHIFNHVGWSYILTSSGYITSLGRSKELALGENDQKIEYAQSIGGDLFILRQDWTLAFYDELFRRVVLDHTFTGPIKVFVYEHAYIISTMYGSYLYHPYEKGVKEIAKWPLVNISGEILSFINENNSIQKIIISSLNPMK